MFVESCLNIWWVGSYHFTVGVTRELTKSLNCCRKLQRARNETWTILIAGKDIFVALRIHFVSSCTIIMTILFLCSMKY